MKIICLLFCVGISTCTGFISDYGSKASNSICQPVRTDLCKGLYNKTFFPSSRHRSQDEAILELKQFVQLIQIKCSENIRLFLCSVFIPFCSILDKPLPPCRSLCLEAKSGCQHLLSKFLGLPWPPKLRCDQFPEYSKTKLCIGEDAKREKNRILKERIIPENRRTKITDREKAVLLCRKPEKIEFKKIVHEKHTCNRDVSKSILKRFCNGESRCEFSLDNIKSTRQPERCNGLVGNSAIKYTCTRDSKLRRIVLNYNEDVQLKCKNRNRHIIILKVQFRSEGCLTPNAFCSISQLCTGKHSCSLWAEGSYIQSSCDSVNTKLTVDYGCVKPKRNEKKIETDLSADIQISCSNGELIKIVRAEYINECYEKEIYCAVSVLCDKQDHCIVNTDNLSVASCGASKRTRVRIRYICT